MPNLNINCYYENINIREIGKPVASEVNKKMFIKVIDVRHCSSAGKPDAGN